MKKEIKYYLEDISRLSKISQSELDAWVAEMPFSQPLQMLAGIKSKMEGHQTDVNGKVHAAYFAEDYEPIQKSKAKRSKLQEKEVKQSATAISTMPSTTSNIVEAIDKDKTTATKENPTDSQIEKETNIVETTPSEIKNPKVVSSDLADEVLEEEVILEYRNIEIILV